MTVTTETSPRRVGVWHRRTPREGWRLVVSHASEAEALKLLVSLAADAEVSGDWKLEAVPPVTNRAGLFDGATV